MLRLFTVVVVLLALAACAICDNRLHGVCAEGQCTELSAPGRRDCLGTLPVGAEWTGTTDAAWLQNPSDPQCIQWDRQCNSDWREDCQNISRDLWPHLNITLEHYNNDMYGLAISWEQPANVTGYMLQMTKEPMEERCNRGRECSSVNITSQDFHKHKCKDSYPFNGPCAGKAFHVKLIPTPWCDGPSTTVPIPESCHNIRPGDCETCGSQVPGEISPPTNVELTLKPQLCEVFLTWEPGENYYGLPYPNISFFLKITYAVNGSEATPQLEVIGKTNVTLQNLTLNVNYSVEIKAGDCGCGRYRSSPVYIYLNMSDVPSSPTSLILAPTSTVHPHSLASTSHISPTPSMSPTSHISPTPSMSPVNPPGISPPILATLLTCILVVVTLVGIIAIAVAIWKTYTPPHKVPSTPPFTPPSTPILISLPPSKLLKPGARVLLIFSLETPKVQQEIILQLLARDLQNCCMEKDGDYVYPEVVWYDRSKLGRGEGMAQWVEREVRACDKVLCVCNKEFKREWEGEIEPIEGSLVSCIKRLYLGSLKEASKYAIVFMRTAHREYYLPTMYFKTSHFFLCEKDSVKNIAHYILGVSTYCLPEPSVPPHIRTSSTYCLPEPNVPPHIRTSSTSSTSSITSSITSTSVTTSLV